MEGRVTFDQMIEEIKSQGEKEKQTIEVAEDIAEIINAITEARIKKELTQRQLADLSGIKQSAIARMESIQAIPRLDTLIKVAKALGIKIKAENGETGPANGTTTVYVLPNSIYNNGYAGESALRALVPAVVGA